MISLTISGQVPTLQGFTFSNAFEKIARELEISIKRYFADGGGHTQWEHKMNGMPSHLYQSGALFNSMTSGFSENEAWAGDPFGVLPYSFVHNFGSEIMPQREYIMFRQEDIQTIRQEMENSIIEFFATKGIKL